MFSILDLVMNNIDIMSPAGNYETLMAAIKAGATSVYFGVGELNMRARNSGFKISDLPKITKICSENNVRSYLCLNTIIYDEDLKKVKILCNIAKKNKVSAIIATDVSVMEYCRRIGVKVHISTQVNVSNIESVKFYSRYADVIVLARELNLKQIRKICNEIKKQKICGPSGNLVRVELFVHGALCVSISGKCYMSLATYNESANRGMCLQNCRRSYKVIDEETGDELVVNNKFIMSPKDLCTIGILDKILSAGVSVLKIEGRARPPEYVYNVTKIYHEAVDAYFSKTYNLDKVIEWVKQLESVFNRGFWQGGYYLGEKFGEWAGVYGSKASEKKIFVGIAKHYFPKAKVGEFLIQSHPINTGDKIIITGNKTGIIQTKVESIYLSSTNKSIKVAHQGNMVTIPIPEKVHNNDKLYVVKAKKSI